MSRRCQSRRPWSKRELAFLRKHYATANSDWIAEQLGRTTLSVRLTAARYRIPKNRQWTARMDDALRMSWGIHTIPQIAESLGRTPVAVYERARLLKLGLGCPQGSANRTGFSTHQLRRVLNWAHVPIRRSFSCPKREKPLRYPHWVVEPSAVDNAVAKWTKTESFKHAMRRHKVCWDTFLRILGNAAMAGHKRVCDLILRRREQVWRIPPDLSDELIAAFRASRAKRSVDATVV